MLLPGGNTERIYPAWGQVDASHLVILSFSRHKTHKCGKKNYQELHSKASLSPDANVTTMTVTTMTTTVY